MIASVPTDTWITLLVVAASMACLVSNRFAAEIVLVGARCLLLLGVLDTSEALAGFANPGLATVAVLYVVVAGLVDTGAVQVIRHPAAGPAAQPGRRAGAADGAVMGLSAFLNNTPVVAHAGAGGGGGCRRHRLSVSKFMLPLSYAAIFGGCCADRHQHQPDRARPGAGRTTLGPMGFFEIAAVGLPVALAGFCFVLLTQRWLLPERILPLQLFCRQRPRVHHRVPAGRGSPLVGKTIERAGLRHLPGSSCQTSGAAMYCVAVPPPRCCGPTTAWYLSARSTRWWNWYANRDWCR